MLHETRGESQVVWRTTEPAVKGRVYAKNKIPPQPYLWPTGLVMDQSWTSVQHGMLLLDNQIGELYRARG